MSENVVEKGVSSLKKLPPVALIGIVVVGVGAVLFIRSRSNSSDTSTDSGETIATMQPEEVVALERPLIGSLPQPIIGGSSTPTNPQDEMVPPRTDPKIPEAADVPIRQPPRQPPRQIGLPPYMPGQSTQPVPGQSTQPVTTQPETQPVATQPAQPPPQVYTPISEVKTYPGLPDNFEPNRQMVQDTSGMRTWSELVQNEKDKNKGGGWNNTAQQRNLAQIAISGTARKGVKIKGSEYPAWVPGVPSSNASRIYTNHVRVSAGLRPFTGQEWAQVQAYLSQLWNGDEKASVFQNGTYARSVFERYNLPYRYI